MLLSQPNALKILQALGLTGRVVAQALADYVLTEWLDEDLTLARMPDSFRALPKPVLLSDFYNGKLVHLQLMPPDRYQPPRQVGITT